MKLLSERLRVFRGTHRLFVLLLTAILLTGCGGGGGGSSSSGPQIVTVTGVLQEKTTKVLLTNRTVTIQTLNLSAVSNASGRFSIANVPVQSIVLRITDSQGTLDGTSAAINLASFSGNPRDIGTLVLDLSGVPPTPPI